MAGAGINSGEVAAAIACMREAIQLRRTSAARLRYFNVIYAIDSDSCADEMESMWQTGELAAVARSAIQPLVETWCHLRAELHALGGHWVFVKFPGHQGVSAMAAADSRGSCCLVVCLQRRMISSIHTASGLLR